MRLLFAFELMRRQLTVEFGEVEDDEPAEPTEPTEDTPAQVTRLPFGFAMPLEEDEEDEDDDTETGFAEVECSAGRPA